MLLTPSIRRLLVLLAAVVCVPMAAAADDADDRALAELFDHGRFAAAAQLCRERLASPQLPAAKRAGLTIDLSRACGDQAQTTLGEAQQALWDEARRVVDIFAGRYPDDPRLILVRAQGALVALAEGEAARENGVVAGNADFTAALTTLRSALTRARRLDEDIAAEVKRPVRARRRDEAAPPPLSSAQLLSLQFHIRQAWARGLRSQALCYAPGSNDRINSLSQALEILTELLQQKLPSDLSNSIRLDEIICLRWLERYPAAEQKLTDLEATEPAGEIARSLLTERIRLALAQGRIEAAQKAAGDADPRWRGKSADFEIARLEAALARWQRTVEERKTRQAADEEKAALAQIAAIERDHGAVWGAKAEALLTRTLNKTAGVEGAEALMRKAGGLYRAGQVDEALRMYDLAARRARERVDPQRAFESALLAATIEKDRQHFRQACDRLRRLAVASPNYPQAAEAHLLAVHCAAQLAAQTQPPKLDEYEKLLREHVAAWPSTPTASQAWWRLGRLQETTGSTAEAITTLKKVRADHEPFAAAVEAIGRCYDTLLAEAQAAGEPNAALAREALAYFEQTARAATGKSEPSDAARLAADLAMARILILEIPGGTARAEKLLADLLATPNASGAAYDGARRLLVVALAGQGRTEPAAALLKQMDGATAADDLALVELLAQAARGANAKVAPQFARLELDLLDGRLMGKDADAALRSRCLRLRAAALAQAGQSAEAIAAWKKIAAENPADGQAAEDLALALADTSDVEQLRAALVQWLAVIDKCRPGSPRWFRANLGVARTQLAVGGAEQARSTIRLVSTTHPELGGPRMKARFDQLMRQCQQALGSAAAGSPPKK